MAGDATPRDGATTRLARRLSVGDAVFIGLGSMIGAGIFTALAPAADAAGAGAIVGLVVAACVASLNALSSAQLARLHPESGGTYVYARERLGDLWAWIAGWTFVVGKFASCAAVALTFGSYLAPGYARYLAAAAVIAFTAMNYRGIEKTAGATKVLVLVVLSTLLCIVVLMLGGAPDPGNLGPLLGSNGVYGVLQSAGIWFFAFAGYSRIATLGEEVRDPRRSIPRAIVLSLGVTCAVYAAVVVSALLVAGPEALAASDAPLVTAVTAAGFGSWQWVVRAGSTVATLGVLVSLMAGISRVLFAMASDGRLPAYLARVHPAYRVPHLAEVTVGLVLVAVVLLADVRSAIGFSSFTVLLYYAVTNMAAFTLEDRERLYGRHLAALGVAGCLGLAVLLPVPSVLGGASVVLVGLAIDALRRRRRPWDHRSTRANPGSGLR